PAPPGLASTRSQARQDRPARCLIGLCLSMIARRTIRPLRRGFPRGRCLRGPGPSRSTHYYRTPPRASRTLRVWHPSTRWKWPIARHRSRCTGPPGQLAGSPSTGTIHRRHLRSIVLLLILLPQSPRSAMSAFFLRAHGECPR
ncbi:unnamed protein product, partial [Ectocarpus sp. 12 AP-2014]